MRTMGAVPGLMKLFAVLFAVDNVDIKTFCSMLGHFSARSTLDTYAHVTASAQKEAAETMG